MGSIRSKLDKVVTDPDIVRRYVVERTNRARANYRDWRAFSSPRRRLLARALALPPVPVPSGGPCAIHTLLGVRGLSDSMFTLKQLYGVLPEPLPLVFHEDGSFDRKHVDLLSRHFPGCRIIRRAEADRVVLGELQSRRLSHCEDFRRRSVMGLKLFDLQWFAQGGRAWYVDTDIAFFSRPDEILEAIAEPDDTFVDRYNEDVRQFYSWQEEQIVDALGTGYPSRPVNAGMVVIRRPSLRWDRLEACFDLPQRTFWDEQTLWAVEFGADGARALAPEYDVCFRHAWSGMNRTENKRALPDGRAVISQHYCGGSAFRRMFYRQLLSER